LLLDLIFINQIYLNYITYIIYYNRYITIKPFTIPINVLGIDNELSKNTIVKSAAVLFESVLINDNVIENNNVKTSSINCTNSISNVKITDNNSASNNGKK